METTTQSFTVQVTGALRRKSPERHWIKQQRTSRILPPKASTCFKSILRIDGGWFLLACLLVLATRATQAQFAYTTNNGTITITGYTGPPWVVTIPASINGLAVTSIGQGAFYGKTNLISVTIPDTVTSIAAGAGFPFDYPGAFDGCISLVSVTLPNHLTEIPALAFNECINLVSVTIPGSVTSIGYQAFYNCGLTNLTLPNSVTSIGGGWPFVGAFENCTNLTSVTIPNSLKVIGDLVFSGCGLTSVTIPDGVTTIGDGAFGYCFNLTNVTIPNSVTSIGDGLTGEGAFQSCRSLGNVTIPESVTYIAALAFANCVNLTGVYFLGNPPGWINDGYSEFEGDTNAVAYYLPGSLGWGPVFDGIPTEQWVPGSLQVIIAPAGAIAAGAQWQVDNNGTWHYSGEVVANLPLGNHTVTFNTIGGWTTPSPQTVSLTTNSFGTVTGLYVWQTGLLQVTISPPAAVAAGAQWQVDGGAWQNNGETVSDLPIGAHTITFSSVFGWTAPSNQTVTITSGATTTATGTYAVSVSLGVRILHSFTGGSDGSLPRASLVEGSDGTFYGASYYGGSGYGLLFAITATGAYKVLHQFTGTSDGELPWGTLTWGPDGKLYGTAEGGGVAPGASGYGTVFSITTNGAMNTLYQFPGGLSGTFPIGPLVLGSNGNFYGTTAGDNFNQSTYGYGTIFTFGTNSPLKTLYSFHGDTNGGLPWGGLTQGPDGQFYGTTSANGQYNLGTVFSITPDGALQTLHQFTGLSDGGIPYSTLAVGADGAFYGTTSVGGSNVVGILNGWGTVFRITTNGNFSTLHQFTGGADGGGSHAGLLPGKNGILYGSTTSGGLVSGVNGFGTLFSITTNGTFSTLYAFSGGNDGDEPWDAPVQGSDGNLYGTTMKGGAYGNGTVFELQLVPASSLQVTTISLPNGTNGLAYSQQLSATNGQLPYSWSISSGLLPSGLALATNGLISGTPTTNGTFNFTVEVTDALSETATQALQLTVVTRPSAAIPLLLSAPSAGSSYYGMYSPDPTAAAFTLTNSYYVSTIDVTLYTPGTNFNTYDFTLQSSLTNPLTVFARQNLTAVVGVSTQVMNINVTLPAGTYYLTSIVPGYFGATVTPGNVDGWFISTGSYNQTGGTIENGLWADGNPPTFTTGGVYVAPAFTVNGIPASPVVLGFGLAQPWTSNGLALMLQGPVGSNYVIQSSTDMRVWLPITNFITTSSPFYFYDPLATHYNQRFYRAVIP